MSDVGENEYKKFINMDTPIISSVHMEVKILRFMYKNFYCKFPPIFEICSKHVNILCYVYSLSSGCRQIYRT